MTWDKVDAELEDELEREQMKRGTFRCNPDESCGQAEDEGYEPDDPKHPTYHGRMSDLWDLRERG